VIYSKPTCETGPEIYAGSDTDSSVQTLDTRTPSHSILRPLHSNRTVAEQVSINSAISPNVNNTLGATRLGALKTLSSMTVSRLLMSAGQQGLEDSLVVWRLQDVSLLSQ